MTSRERFLKAMRNEVPDRIPVAPDFSNYIPCKLTGLPFWDIYFFGQIPLWKAYLNAVKHFGIDAWVGSTAGTPFIYEETKVDIRNTYEYNSSDQSMIQNGVIKTPAGTLTYRSLCFRSDPPSPIEKPIKDISSDFAAFKMTQPMAVRIDDAKWNEMKTACEKCDQAFGVHFGYPGFHMWFVHVEGGLLPLSYAEMDSPALLEEWLEWDLARGTREMELLVAKRPDYILFGGSGTITMASPDLARKYAIPALKKWSAMAKAAGIPTMLHSCGKSRELVNMLCDETDVNCINPLEIAPMGDVDLAEVKKARGKQIALMGNLHTTDVMLKGTSAQVRAASIQAMRDAGTGGGFILSTGDQCGPATPEENIFAMVEAANEFGKYGKDGTLPLLKIN